MAASKDFAVLDLQNGSDELGMDLQFQDFGEARTQPAVVSSSQHEQTIHFTEYPDSATDEQEQEKLMGDSEGGEPAGLKAGASFWTFDFYQQFFDVESKQVGDRILWSMVPKPGVSYLQSYIRPNPDLYGPFWICTTLAVTTAITGNLANYLATPTNETYVWRYEFRKVTFAASAIFAYAWLIPLAVWGLLVWRGSRAKISLLELLCIYGYSLAIFVPVSVLWLVPQDWFKWCLAIVAPVLSGSVLVRTVWPSLSHDTKQVAIGIAGFILVLHATLALGFMLYFFTAPAGKVTPGTPDVPVANGTVPQPPSTNQGTETVETDSQVKKDKKTDIQEEDKDPGDNSKKEVGGGEGKVSDGSKKTENKKEQKTERDIEAKQIEKTELSDSEKAIEDKTTDTKKAV
ncbi:YIPF1-like [Homarus americanus]|uniref:YIPF1-like n=1 Tax=Homarus americanus TaxID=6706 RepID=A0A8J5MZJ2_HOMAM|nr:YIPF1-like [Homarus americanus]